MSLFLSTYSRLLVVSLPPSHHLDVTLTQAVQVGTDAHGATRDVGQGEGVLGSGEAIGALQVILVCFDAKNVRCSYIFLSGIL